MADLARAFAKPKPPAKTLGEAVREYQEPSTLQSAWDEISGAFARYGRRSGAQRDASLALMSQAAGPNTDPLTGAGMKALGLAGLVTHPLAFFPTREEWDQRLQAAGNDSRLGRSIGGFLSDLPSLIDPQMAAGGAVLATAPLAAKIMNKADDVADAGITAYHASPYKFDKFSMQHIGTGHGKQQEGAGLYFTDDSLLADEYWKNHAGKSPEAIAEKFATNWGPEAASKLEQFAARRSQEMRPEAVKPLYDALEMLRSGADTSSKGARYMVRISAAGDEILDLTKGGKVPVEIGDPLKLTPETAKKNGIKVLAYKAGVESSNPRAKNYVVFDESIITILKKYGIPMTAGAGGAMMVAGQDMPPELASQMGGT